MKKLITLSFLPSLPNIGILLLRLWFGLSIFWIHGLDKAIHMGDTIKSFGEGGIPSYLAVCAILSECLASLCVAVGFATRCAALAVGTTMFVAFSHAHHYVLDPKAPFPPGSGEMAFLYLGAFAVIFFTGGGRFSVDTQLSKPSPV